ncbi:sucrase ferredoxin [Nocardioides marmoriginsengisoli]|uniref:Sucrase ferredoxin n=1 Tax=Nocardioides marmoriginsengisoli TaxID=661483 RepID=A0A3N0CN40_9ACTN|nr:sucrase ferredoxin [Nocardioides marmoriginsengisoli]RNL64884.1 sucrase ferredoxin [Nocardioides marmoriginsengisoli]
MTTTCTDATAAAGEALIGSAPDAIAWVCLEQNGPWGKKAWTDSHLDVDLGRAIEEAAGVHGVRPSLIRRPGKHADATTGSERAVLVGYTHPDGSWLLTGTIAAPEALLDLDWAAVAAGDAEAVRRSLPALEPDDQPRLLVCTNGTRDTCCARLGRPVAAAALAAHPGRVWEVTHTSGHRFAATTVLLPAGVLHGRVLDAAPLLAAADAGEVVLTGYRGRSTWSAGAQVAEEHVRRTEGITGIDDLVVVPEIDAWSVRHRDGRRWWVAVSASTGGERPPSCGKPDEPFKSYVATTVSVTP